MKQVCLLLMGFLIGQFTTACREGDILRTTRQQVYIADFSEARTFELDASRDAAVARIAGKVTGTISQDVLLTFRYLGNTGVWNEANRIPLAQGNYENKAFEFDFYTPTRVQLIVTAPRNTTGNLTIDWGL